MRPKNKCYIVTKNKEFFTRIEGFEKQGYEFCNLEDMVLTKTISFDTETEGLNCLVDDVFSIQIGTGKNNYLIDLQKYDTPLVFGKQIYIEEVFPYLEGRELVAHNMSFDLGFLYKKGFYPDKIYDTMIASQILHNGDTFIYSHAFGAVMERELNLVYDKTEQKNIYKSRLSTTTALEYCFNDVDRLLDLHNDLLQKVSEYGSLESYLLNCDMIKAQTYMEMCGLPLCETSWLNKMETDKLNSLKAQELIKEYVYDNLPQFRNRQTDMFDLSKRIKVNLGSPKQTIPIFESLGINVVDDKGKKSIKENVINKTKHEFVDLWKSYKESQHRVESFGQSILDKVVDGRIYSRFKLIADTNRMISRAGEINFLNFPADKETRSCIVAKKGFKIIVSDFDSQEVTTLASVSLDKNTIDNLVKKRDPHCLLAREIFPELKDLTDKEIKNLHSDKRQIGKVGNFTFSFGGNGYTAAKNLNIPIEEGNKIYEAYKKLYDGVFEWGETVLEEAIKKGYIESADGFKLKLPNFKDYKKLEKLVGDKNNEFWQMYKAGKIQYIAYWESVEANKLDSEKPIIKIEDRDSYDLYVKNKPTISEFFKLKSSYFRLSLNNPIQSRAAHESKRAMVNLFKYIMERGHLWRVKIINFIYDEIVLEVEDSLCGEYKEKLGEIMRDSANYYLDTNVVKMGAEAEIGLNWYSAKKGEE